MTRKKAEVVPATRLAGRAKAGADAKATTKSKTAAKSKTATKPKSSPTRIETPKPATPVHRGGNGKVATATAQATATAGTSSLRMIPPVNGVGVRMYRTGLGDCFLLALPKGKPGAGAAQDAFYMLVDCGVYRGTPEPGNTTRMKSIVADIQAATGGRLDLLLVTHEHWDHVSGFHASQTQDMFQKIDLGKLWLAWTEDPDNALAQQLRAGRTAARVALTAALHKMNGMAGAAESPTADIVRKVLGFFGDVSDAPAPGAPSPSADEDAGIADDEELAPEFGIPGRAMGAALGAAGARDMTGEAMNWLKQTYGKGKTAIVHPGDGPIPLDGVDPGLARVYILGPPEDATLIKKYNPSASGDEVYPKAMAAAMEMAFFSAFGVIPSVLDDLIPGESDAEDARRRSMPFENKKGMKISIDDAKAAGADSFFRRNYLDTEAWRTIEGDWLDSASEFALKLDSATNNTSLAFALEIGPPGEGKVLLFPGDAQVGNWQSWFGKVVIRGQSYGKDMAWRAGARTVTAEDLLRRTVLYKVGHHGSHNATLRASGLELMGPPHGSPELVAMIPVDEEVARVNAGYGEMPLRSLVKDLLIRTHGHVARNDEGKPANPKDETATLGPIPGAPAPDSKFAKKTDLYFEYAVVTP